MKTSNCCGSCQRDTHDDICPVCGEHCEFMDDVKEFLQQIDTGVISGSFDLTDSKEELMDRMFRGIDFENVRIQGGDFCSGIFKYCVFRNVVFDNVQLVGVSFIDCKFDKCSFERKNTSFTLA